MSGLMFNLTSMKEKKTCTEGKTDEITGGIFFCRPILESVQKFSKGLIS